MSFPDPTFHLEKWSCYDCLKIMRISFKSLRIASSDAHSCVEEVEYSN